MYPVSQAFLTAVMAAYRDTALKIHIDTAFESFDLDDADVLDGSFKCDCSGLSGDTMAPGGVKAADLAVTLLNKGGRYDDVQFNGGLLTAQYGIKTASGDYEWAPLGTFNIDDVSRPTSVITLGAMDNLLLFDVPFSDVGVTFPATNLQILSAICNHVGVTLKTADFVNASYTVQSVPDGSLSCRDILSDIAEMAAGFARCDYTGALEIIQWQGVGCVQEVDADGGTFTPSKNLLNPAAGTLTGVGSAAATQVINNGNFATDSNGDKVPDGFALNNASPVSLAGGEFTFRATAQYGSCSYGTTLTPGRRYFIRAEVKAFSNKVKLQATKSSGQYLNAYHPGDGAYHTLDFVVDIPSGFTSATVYVQDELASGWQNISIKNFIAVDMGQSYYATTQAITNGNFASSANNLATGFTLSGATAVSCTGNTQTFKATAQSGRINLGTSGILLANHRYFVCVNMKASTNLIKLQVQTGTSTYASAAHPGDGAYHLVSLILDIASGFSGSNIWPAIDFSSSGWQNVSVQDFMAIDMGTDASNPLFNKTADWMATEYPSYVEGSLAANPFYEMTADKMNTMAQKKGYWEGSSQLGGVDVTVAADGMITLNGIPVAVAYIEITPYLQPFISAINVYAVILSQVAYTFSKTVISGTRSGTLYAAAIDDVDGGIAVIPTQSIDAPVTFIPSSTQKGVTRFWLVTPSSTVFSAYTFRLQLEQGTTATAWVPYGYLDGDTLDGGDFNRWNNKDYDGGVFSEPSPVVSLGPTNRYNFSVDDSPVKVTGIELDADDQTYLVGTDYYAIHISDNKLIQGDPTDALNAMLDVFQDFAFLPFTSDWQGNPALQPGDIIEQIDRNGVHYRTIITESDFAYRGKCSLSAKGASELNQGYQAQLTKKVSQLQRAIHNKQVQLDSLDQAIVSATGMIAGALGGYFVNGDTLDDEQYHGNVFICDSVGSDPAHPDVTKATKVWRWNLGGFGYSSNGISGPYTTAITANGSIVANLVAAGIVTADLIKAGLLQSKDGSSWLNLDTGALSFAKGAFTYDPTNGMKLKDLIADWITSGMLKSQDGSSQIDLTNGTFTFAKSGMSFDSSNGLSIVSFDKTLKVTMSSGNCFSIYQGDGSGSNWSLIQQLSQTGLGASKLFTVLNSLYYCIIGKGPNPGDGYGLFLVDEQHAGTEPFFKVWLDASGKPVISVKDGELSFVNDSTGTNIGMTGKYPVYYADGSVIYYLNFKNGLFTGPSSS